MSEPHDFSGKVMTEWNAAVSDMLLSEDASERMAGRLMATGVAETIQQWVLDEQKRNTTDRMFAAQVIQAVSFLYITVVGSYTAKLNQGRAYPPGQLEAAADGLGGLLASIFKATMPALLKAERENRETRQ